MADFKLRAFYSDLANYIYINSSKQSNIFENIDAFIYGLEVSGDYYFSDEAAFEMQAAYKRGLKKQALLGQSDRDLADIAPLEAKAGLVWEYRARSYARLDIRARDRWRYYDADNGEQPIDAWSVVDIKLKHSFKKGVSLTVGARNLFDQTYAKSNTYKDLTLVMSTGAKGVLLNEPGRYIYADFVYTF